MQTEKEIRKQLERVEGDERLSQPSANTDINAPLALVQLELETRRDTLKWVLGKKGD